MSEKNQNRIDKILVKKKMVKSRSQAQFLLESGVIYVDGSLVRKSNTIVSENQNFEIRKRDLYVGRGAIKIKDPIDKFKIEVLDKTIADIGASTGGFTEYVLRLGAKKVYAVDVGHHQLDETLVKNNRVINLEGINVKHSFSLDEKVDLGLVDLSFISLKLVLKNIFLNIKKNGDVLALVKPQFEAGRDKIGKKGVIKDKNVHFEVLSSLFKWCLENKIYLKDFSESPIKGKTGNQEFFFLLTKDESADVCREGEFKYKEEIWTFKT